jgi:hypothetical protein
MSMHRFHIYPWKYVIDKANMILSKRATIHQSNSLQGWFASRYPTAQTRFQNYLARRCGARGIIAQWNKLKNGTAGYPS